jgi:natural product precursor
MIRKKIKLDLNNETIAKLSSFQLNKLKGGENVLQDAAKEEAFV